MAEPKPGESGSARDLGGADGALPVVPAGSALDKPVEGNAEKRDEIAAVAAGKRSGEADDNASELLVTAGASEGAEASEDVQKAGKLHEAYLKKTSEIKDAADVQNKLRGSSIADVRYNTSLLNGVQENKDPKLVAVNLKSETAKRLSAYTSGRDKDWYILDYESMGSDQDGMSHEMNVGLGDVLLDPDITDVLIEQNGVMIKAHRGVVSSGRHAGRVGFLDESGEYIATFTGDKFKILSDNEVNLEDEKSLSAYTKAVEGENSARASGKQTFDQEVAAVKEGNAYLQEADLFKGDFSEEGSVVDQIGGLSASQLANARIIEEEFKAAGLQNSIIAAAIINAYVESGLRADNAGDNGKSVGLFQLASFGAGRGMSVAERCDPRINTRTILKREVLTKRGDLLRSEAQRGASVQKLAIIFSRTIERPAAWGNKIKAGIAANKIAGITKKLFGGQSAA